MGNSQSFNSNKVVPSSNSLRRNSEEPTTINPVPDLKEVCDYLSFQNILTCRLVCKDWENFIRLKCPRFAEAKVQFSPSIFLMTKKDIKSSKERPVPWKTIHMNFFPFPSKSVLMPYWYSCGEYVRILHLKSLSIECTELIRFLESCPVLQEVTFEAIGFKPTFVKKEVKKKSKKDSIKSDTSDTSSSISSVSKKESKSRIASGKSISKKNVTSESDCVKEKENATHKEEDQLTSTQSHCTVLSKNERVKSQEVKLTTVSSLSKSKCSTTGIAHEETGIKHGSGDVAISLDSKLTKTLSNNNEAEILLEETKSNVSLNSSNKEKASENKEMETISEKAEANSGKLSSDAHISSVKSGRMKKYRPDNPPPTEIERRKWESTRVIFCSHNDLPTELHLIKQSKLVAITFKEQNIIPVCLLYYLSNRSFINLQKFVYLDSHLSPESRDYMNLVITPNITAVESEIESFMMLRCFGIKSLTISGNTNIKPFLKDPCQNLKELYLKSKNASFHKESGSEDEDKELQVLKQYRKMDLRILEIEFFNPEKQKMEEILEAFGKKNKLEKLKIALTMGKIDLQPMLKNLTGLLDLDIVEVPYYEDGKQFFGTVRGFHPSFLSELPESLESLSLQLSYKGDNLEDLIFQSSNRLQNLKQLKLNYSDLDDSMFQQIIKNCSLLEVLHVHNSKILSDTGITGVPNKDCRVTRNTVRHWKDIKLEPIRLMNDLLTIPAKDRWSVSNLKHLKILSLEGCIHVSELSLAWGIQLESLRVLVLSGCTQVRGDYAFECAFEKNPNIQKLVIFNINYITARGIIDLALHTKTLLKIHLDKKKLEECMDASRYYVKAALNELLTSEPPSVNEISMEYVKPITIVPSVSEDSQRVKRRRVISTSESSCSNGEKSKKDSLRNNRSTTSFMMRKLLKRWDVKPKVNNKYIC